MTKGAKSVIDNIIRYYRIFFVGLLVAKTCSGFSSTTRNPAPEKGRINNNGKVVLPVPAPIVSRRVALSDAAAASAAVAAISASLLAPIENAYAATTDVGETVRRSAANIPGYGPSDVFYPESLLGSWKMKREVVTSDGRSSLTLEYPVRFLRSIEDTAVIADRGYNQAQLEKALQQQRMIRLAAAATATATTSAQTQQQQQQQGETPKYEWSERNPNDLRLLFSNGSRKEIKVTKRATERTESTVFSSEFQRVTTQEGSGEFGIPVITARRVLTKWKITLDDAAVGSSNAIVVEGIEIVNDVGGGMTMGDPLSSKAAGAGASSNEPKQLSKSFLRLQRE